MGWPGYDEDNPVILNAGRPGRIMRPRLASAHQPLQGPFYQSPNGQFLVPAPGLSGRAHRSNSAAGERPPAQVIINNELQWEEHSPSRRPRSSYGHDHYYHHDNYEDRRGDRSRSRERVRRNPSPYYYENRDERRRERSRSHDRVRTNASPHHHHEIDHETQHKLARLEELERKEEEHRRREQIEEEKRRARWEENEKKEAEQKRKKQIEDELLLKASKEEKEKAQRKKEEEEFAKKAVAAYEAKEKEKKEKEKKEKEATEKLVEEGVRKTLRAQGYTEAEIEKLLKKGDKGKAPPPANVHAGALTLARPTYIKVHKKHLDPETLNVYHLPWEWDVSHHILFCMHKVKCPD